MIDSVVFIKQDIEDVINYYLSISDSERIVENENIIVDNLLFKEKNDWTYIINLEGDAFSEEFLLELSKERQTSVYKGYKQDKIEMRGDRAEMSDFPLYLNTVAGGLDRRDQTIGGFSFVVKIYAVPVVEIIGQLLYLLGRYGFNAQFSDCL